MPALPNPFAEFAGGGSPSADSAAASSPLAPKPSDAADSFYGLSDEPLPLCLTTPHGMIDREIEEILRVVFGIHNRQPGAIYG